MLYFTIYIVRTNQTENGTDRESERSNFPNNLHYPRLLFLRWIEIAEMYKRKSVEIFHFLEVNENPFYNIYKKKNTYFNRSYGDACVHSRECVLNTCTESEYISSNDSSMLMLVDAPILEQNRNPRFYSKLIRNARKYRVMKITD